MYRIIKIIIPVFIIAIFWIACAPKIYQAPHLGAEYRFDEGLKPQKPKQQLFSRNMHRYLREKGVEQPSSGKPQAATVKQTGTTPQKVAADSTRRDTTTTLAPPSLTTSPDSSHSVQH